MSGVAAGEEGLLRLSLCNILTGELLAELRLSPADSLQAAAVERLPELLPFSLLHNSEPCGASSCRDLGLEDGATIHVMRCARAKKFTRVIGTDFCKIGYHTHDSYLKRVATQDANRFVVAWARRYRGKDFYMERDHDRPLTHETVTMDLTSWAGSATPVSASDPNSEPEEDTVDNVRKHLRITCKGPGGRQRMMHPLAISSAGDVYMEVTENYDQYRICLGKDDADSELPTLFNAEKLSLYDALFVKTSLYMIGCTEQDTSVILELASAEDGSFSQLRRQTLDKIPSATKTWLGDWQPQFLGLDTTGEALWFCNMDGVFVLCLETLSVSTCLLWQQMCKHVGHWTITISEKDVVMDLHTRQLYILFDASLLPESSAQAMGLPAEACHVRCLLPTPRDGGRPWDVTYVDLPGELVCGADFEIDGFSDSFCIGASHFLPDKRQIMVLDAGGELWIMQL